MQPTDTSTRTADVPALEFLTPDLYKILEAACERILPADEIGPGAAKAGAAAHIDRALAGAYLEFQDLHEAGLRGLEALARARFQACFSELSAREQDELISSLEAGRAPGFTFPEAAQFFEVLLTHTREGLFSDPSHGGNRQLAGWRLPGFPGVQHEFLPEEQLGSGLLIETIGTATHPASPRRRRHSRTRPSRARPQRRRTRGGALAHHGGLPLPPGRVSGSMVRRPKSMRQEMARRAANLEAAVGGPGGPLLRPAAQQRSRWLDPHFCFHLAALQALQPKALKPLGPPLRPGSASPWLSGRRLAGFYEDRELNRFAGPLAQGVRIDDFNHAEFDSRSHGFVTGASMGAAGQLEPIHASGILPSGTKRWGAEYKRTLHCYYNRFFTIAVGGGCEMLPYDASFLNLDPHFQNSLGRRVIRLTFDAYENKHCKYEYLVRRIEEIAWEMGPHHVTPSPLRITAFGTHDEGGTRIGDDPSTSVCDSWGRTWEVPNLFVMGGSLFPTMSS